MANTTHNPNVHVFLLSGRSSFTSNTSAVRHGLGCSTNIHFIHSGLHQRPKFFFFLFLLSYNGEHDACVYGIVAIALWY